MELSDVGKEVELMAYNVVAIPRTFTAKVGMVIKAPKGMCLLFDRPYNQDEQSQAVKTFMEEHRND